jgi:hypothetical protein
MTKYQKENKKKRKKKEKLRIKLTLINPSKSERKKINTKRK